MSRHLDICDRRKLVERENKKGSKLLMCEYADASKGVKRGRRICGESTPEDFKPN
jgi:hypothetical protein